MNLSNEILDKIKNSGRVVFSDAFIAIISGTTRQGNSMKAPIEAIRKKGLIPKKILPQLYGFDETYDKKRITDEMYKLGEEFAKRFTINYEIVYEVHYEEELKDDLLNVAGFAWPVPINGEYPKSDFLPNHVFIAYRLPKYYIYDNYTGIDGDFIKKLVSDYDFLDYGYRIFISSETTPEERKIQVSVFDILLKNKLIEFFLDWWNRFISSKEIPKEITKDAVVVEPPIMPPEAPASPVVEIKYLWDSPSNARHSVRVIMDDFNLAWKEKDLLCACIQQESGFNPKAIGRVNSNGTQDFGLCQFNNGKNKQGVPYWIGEGAAFKDVDEVLNNPEKNVRIMIQEFKKGNLRYWASFSTGAYKKYLSG